MFFAADTPFTDDTEFDSDGLNPWERRDPESQQNSQVTDVFSICKATLSSFAVAQTEASHPAHSLSQGMQDEEAIMHRSDPQASHNHCEDGESSPLQDASGHDTAGMQAHVHSNCFVAE